MNFSLAPLLCNFGLVSKNSTRGLRSSSGNSLLPFFAVSPSEFASAPRSAADRFLPAPLPPGASLSIALRSSLFVDTDGSYMRMAAREYVPGRNRTGARARSTSIFAPSAPPDSSVFASGVPGGAAPKSAMTSGWFLRLACFVHCTSCDSARFLNPDELESVAPVSSSAPARSKPSSSEPRSSRSIGSCPSSPSSLTPSPSDSSPSFTTKPSSSSSEIGSPSSSASTSSSDKDSPSSTSSHSSPESKYSPSSATYSTFESLRKGVRPVTCEETRPGRSGNTPEPQNAGRPPSTGNVLSKLPESSSWGPSWNACL